MGRPGFFEDFGIDRHHLLRDALPGVVFAGAHPSELSHALGAFGLALEPGQAIGQGFRIARRHQVAGDAVEYRVLDAADAGADHGARAGHRLDRRDAEWFVPGRAGEHVGGGVIVAQDVARLAALEADVGRDAEFARQLAQAREFGAVVAGRWIL